MSAEYIRMIIETGRSRNDGLYIVQAIKEEDHGPAMSLVAVLARVMERIGTPHKLKLLAHVITILGHGSVSATFADPCLVDAEEELIAAAHQLVKDWAKSEDDTITVPGEVVLGE